MCILIEAVSTSNKKSKKKDKMTKDEKILSSLFMAPLNQKLPWLKP